MATSDKIEYRNVGFPHEQSTTRKLILEVNQLLWGRFQCVKAIVRESISEEADCGSVCFTWNRRCQSRFHYRKNATAKVGLSPQEPTSDYRFWPNLSDQSLAVGSHMSILNSIVGWFSTLLDQYITIGLGNSKHTLPHNLSLSFSLYLYLSQQVWCKGKTKCIYFVHFM